MHTRRTFLAGGLAALVPLRLRAQRCEPTAPNIEGPFFRDGAPPRRRLASRPTLVVHGTLQDPGCRPLADAALEVWHAGADGEYDLEGFRHRGVIRTDPTGRYRFETIVPGRYRLGATYRPAHIHLKVRATGRPTLTTQLYFEGDPYNDGDPWIRDSLVLRPRSVRDHAIARFPLVV